MQARAQAHTGRKCLGGGRFCGADQSPLDKSPSLTRYSPATYAIEANRAGQSVIQIYTDLACRSGGKDVTRPTSRGGQTIFSKTRAALQANHAFEGAGGRSPRWIEWKSDPACSVGGNCVTSSRPCLLRAVFRACAAQKTVQWIEWESDLARSVGGKDVTSLQPCP